MTKNSRQEENASPRQHKIGTSCLMQRASAENLRSPASTIVSKLNRNALPGTLKLAKLKQNSTGLAGHYNPQNKAHQNTEPLLPLQGKRIPLK